MQGLTVRVDKLGRILLPAGVRKAAGLEPDTRLIVRVHAGRIELMTLAGAVRMAQSIVRRHVKPGARVAPAVIDASAVLALLDDEPGSERVAQALGGAAISAVNLAEVLGRLRRRGLGADAAAMAVDSLALEVVAFDRDLAAEAAEIEALAVRHGLSLGDRACLATARRLRRPAITADRAWLRLGIGVRVVSIR